MQVYCTVVFLKVKFKYLELYSINPWDFFTICSTKNSSLPHKKITRLSWTSSEILTAQGSKVRYLLPSIGRKVVWPIRYLSIEFWQLVIFTVYSLHFSAIKLIRPFDVFFIILFSKYHAYKQLSIFCHGRLKFILGPSDSSKIDRAGVK